MIKYAKTFGGWWPWPPIGYAYAESSCFLIRERVSTPYCVKT